MLQKKKKNVNNPIDVTYFLLPFTFTLPPILHLGEKIKYSQQLFFKTRKMTVFLKIDNEHNTEKSMEILLDNT